MAKAGSQTDARQTAEDLMRERPCCFPVSFDMQCQGMAFTLATTTERSSGTQGAGWVGGTLAKSPDITPSIDLAGWLHVCLGWWRQDTAECSSWCCGNPHVLLSFLHFVILYPACSDVSAILQLLSRWLNKSLLVNKGLGHLPGKFWCTDPPQKS